MCNKMAVGVILIVAMIALGQTHDTTELVEARESLSKALCTFNAASATNNDTASVITVRLKETYQAYFMHPLAKTPDSLSIAARKAMDALKKKVHDKFVYSLMSKYGKKTADAVKNEEIFIGMPRVALIESWGDPDKINSTVNAMGKLEQFVYGNLMDGGHWVYVMNGKITSWQTF